MNNLLRRMTAAFCVLTLSVTPAAALTVEDAVGVLEESYVDVLPPAAYGAATLDELFEAVGDPYTYYMNAEDYAAFNAGVESESSVTGLGVAVEYTADGLLIDTVLPGGGAEEAGLTSGDLIVAVEGVSCAPASEQHRALIAGEEGTYVTITVQHADGRREDYRIQRRRVEIHNTVFSTENGVTTVDCDSFGTLTDDHFLEGIEEHRDKTDLWVVDLRGNAGGLADVAVNTLGFFTGPGPKLYYRERGGGYFYTLYPDPPLTDKPVVVLVDGGSASASEVFAGGIRASNRGVVLGSRTFGKGTAQLVFSKENRPDLFDEDSLKVTAYRFYCADGSTSDRVGVIPTIAANIEDVPLILSLLSTRKPEAEEYYRLLLNGVDFYLPMETLEAAENADAVTALFSALPPDATVAYHHARGESKTNPMSILALYGDESAARRFSDLQGSPYQKEINTLRTYDILQGIGGDRFEPQRQLTRAELCAMLAQALNVTTDWTDVFADVPADSWFGADVNVMAGLGLVQGVGGRRFAPDAALTQEQFIAVMGRLAVFLNLPASNYTDELGDLSEFEELRPLAPWAREGAAVLTDFGSAYSDDGSPLLYASLPEIDPQAPVTREQAAATLCRVLKGLGMLAY